MVEVVVTPNEPPGRRPLLFASSFEHALSTNSAAAAPVTPFRNCSAGDAEAARVLVGKDVRAPDDFTDERRVGNGQELAVRRPDRA